MRAILIDLETWPCLTPEMLSEIEAEIEAETKAPGNYKDPSKIAAYVEEAKAKAKAKAIEKAALSPLTGAICLVTIAEVDATPGGTIRQFGSPLIADETVCIREALGYLADIDRGHQIVTFNGQRFDLPFLAIRAMVRGISSPWPIPRAKDWARHLDLYQALGEPGSLDRCARAILGRGKGDVTGADVPRLWATEPERVREYARNEMELLIGIYRAWREVTMPELLK